MKLYLQPPITPDVSLGNLCVPGKVKYRDTYEFIIYLGKYIFTRDVGEEFGNSFGLGCYVTAHYRVLSFCHEDKFI